MTKPLQSEVRQPSRTSSPSRLKSKLKDAESQRSEARPPARARKKQARSKPRKPIWEVIAELGAQIPLSEWEKIPTDLAENFEHYHHGAPKQNP